MRNAQGNTQGRLRHVLFPSHKHELWSVNRRGVCVQCGERLQRGATKYCSIECYRVVQRSGSTIDRFWAKVKKADGCWLWTAKRSSLSISRANGGSTTHLAGAGRWRDMAAVYSDTVHGKFIEHKEA